jgi:hypothetical protein
MCISEPPKGPSSAPGLKSLAFDDFLPESPFENGARLHYRSPRGLGELPRGAATCKRSGFHLNSEEVRCVQGLWTQAALLANEQWNESSDESELPRRVMHQPQCACEISALTGLTASRSSLES